MSYGRPQWNLAYASFDGAAAYTRPAYNAADAEWTDPTPVEAHCAARSMLGAAQIVATAPPAAQAHAASMLGIGQLVVNVSPLSYVQAASPLGAARIVGGQYAAAIAAGPAILSASAPRAAVMHDFTAVIRPDTGQAYFADLVTPGGTVRVPIGSWQATLQTDRESYAQVVVPALAEIDGTVTDATEFAVVRAAATISGQPIEFELVRCPVETIALAQGAANYTATLSGYTDPFTADPNPPAGYDRQLTGVRTVFTYSSGMRVRCAIDWLLQPGQRAYWDTTPILVAYINYYVGGGDAYMDVGDRAS
jgi:hypothetical protein